MAIIQLPNTSGVWALSRIIEETSTFPGANSSHLTAATYNRTADRTKNYYAPWNVATNNFYLPFALCTLEGNIQPPTNDTIILPDIDSTLGALSPPLRNQLRNNLESMFGNYEYTDQINRQRIKQAFVTSGYTNATTIRQILVDLFDHMDHGEFYDLGLTEVHNTEYTDDFTTNPSSRWNHLGDSFSWDNPNSEYDCSYAGGEICSVYTNGNAGSLDHESQITSTYNSSETRMVGTGARMYNNASYDFYCFYGDGSAAQWQIGRSNSGGGVNVQSTASQTFTNGYFYTFCLAAEGTGSQVDLSAWGTEHTSKPADPGWTTNVGSETDTYADTSASRLVNGSNHVDCGMGAKNAVSTDVDTRCCFFKLRAVSDRGGAPAASSNLTLLGVG